MVSMVIAALRWKGGGDSGRRGRGQAPRRLLRNRAAVKLASAACHSSAFLDFHPARESAPRHHEPRGALLHPGRPAEGATRMTSTPTEQPRADRPGQRPLAARGHGPVLLRRHAGRARGHRQPGARPGHAQDQPAPDPGRPAQGAHPRRAQHARLPLPDHHAGHRLAPRHLLRHVRPLRPAHAGDGGLAGDPALRVRLQDRRLGQGAARRRRSRSRAASATRWPWPCSPTTATST